MKLIKTQCYIKNGELDKVKGFQTNKLIQTLKKKILSDPIRKDGLHEIVLFVDEEELK